MAVNDGGAGQAIQAQLAKGPEKGASAKSLEDVLIGALTAMARGAFKNIGFSAAGQLGEVSAVSGFEKQGLAAQTISHGQSFSTSSKMGEALIAAYKAAGLEKVLASTVEALQQTSSDGMQGQHVSLEALFQLQPLSTPNLRGGEGLYLA